MEPLTASALYASTGCNSVETLRHWPAAVSTSRLANLRATLGFLRLPPTEPELVMLHQVFDSGTGLGQMAVGLARQGYLLGVPLRQAAIGAS